MLTFGKHTFTLFLIVITVFLIVLQLVYTQKPPTEYCSNGSYLNYYSLGRIDTDTALDIVKTWWLTCQSPSISKPKKMAFLVAIATKPPYVENCTFMDIARYDTSVFMTLATTKCNYRIQ